MTRVALVTGAAGGIGHAICRALAMAGFRIAANDRSDSDEFQRRIEALRELGVEVAPVIGDVADIAEHQRMLELAEEALGPLSVLVNNAGVPAISRGDLLEVSPESYDRCQAVNTRAVFFLSQAFARHVIAHASAKGTHRSIVNITSSNAVAASETRGEYCVSKTAVSMVTRLFAVRLARDDIAVYEVQPGVIDTDMIAPVKADYAERITDGLTLTPRMGLPQDVGSAVAVLAEGKLAYSTAQALRVDGGLLVQRF